MNIENNNSRSVSFESDFDEDVKTENAGNEIAIGKRFNWGGSEWIVPSAYICKDSVAIDFIMSTSVEKLRNFVNKWDLSRDSVSKLSIAEKLELEKDDPQSFNFKASIELNGKNCKLGSSRKGMIFNPLLLENESDIINRKVIRHFNLDENVGWSFWRMSFPCSKILKINSLTLKMEHCPRMVSGGRFNVNAPGDTFSFIYPNDGQTYTITVKEYRREKFGGDRLSDKWVYPKNYIYMSYTISPKKPDNFYIQDSRNSDSAKPEPGSQPNKAATSIIIHTPKPSDKSKNAVCSSAYFEPPKKVEWLITYRENPIESGFFILI